ncbi:trigger factor [Alkalispirochaeta sphaeroplastigenens]|uniref:Trigger factor n=1 Tax=Alkalispirochaeta sphaeroplastigenens TaxID=1187066 RepID=A0A2S4JG29_9SPIO|nr:trigger factor [Alkalispirochaeta sphaeroplastigenens]POQ98517.1 trigger factor [Alkalispirochaeta sphaeroplastigenens]
MIQEKKIEKRENSAVQLHITIPQDEVRVAYDDLVKKYAKSAQIKGFRKGKVPRDILERRFGEGFRAEALQNLLEAGLEEALKDVEERPLPYTRPTLVEEDLELDLDAPLSFSVTYDVFPDVTPGTYEGLTVTEPKVSITKADEDRELEELRQQNALIIEKEEGAVAEGDIVTVTLEELDDQGAPLEATRQEDITITAGQEENFYRIDKDLIGFSRGETRTIEKEYTSDDDHESLKGQKKRLQVTVSTIKQRDVPELDDEFAQDVSDEFETLKDLRKDIKQRLTGNAEKKVRNMMIDELMNQISANTPLDIPASMVQTELESSWRGLAEQYRATPEQLEQLLTLQGKTRDEIFDEWRPSALERLKRSLIAQKLIELEKIEISDDEAEEQVRKDAQERKADPEPILEYYRNNNMLSYVKQDLAERALFDRLLEKSTVKAGDKIKYLDLMAENG